MFTLQRLIRGTLIVLFLFTAVLAQENRAPVETPGEPVASGPLVTATASAKRVRFVSPGSVVQLRLEVYNEAGLKLFDTELHGGNVLDWHLQDGAGERLPASSYACVLTIKSLSGRISRRVGMVTVNDKKAAVEAAGGVQLSSAQQQVIGPVEDNAAFTVLLQSEAEAITAVTHDGSDGQMTSTKGALTFRTGDLFAGKDKEHMRITEDGKVGIGTDKPEATLDVAGSLRVSEGVRFSDGTTLDAASGKLTVRDAKGDPVNVGGTKAAGTGTANRVAKWTETGGAGTLGDSAITEVNGAVVVGSLAQTGTLQIAGAAGQDVFAGMGPDINAGPAFNFGYAGLSIGRSAGFFNVRPDASATAPNPSLRFMTTNVERMIVTNLGNVGIGTSSPTARLDVNGNINTSAQYNIGGSRVFSIPGPHNTFAGLNAGLANTTGGVNSFFGSSAGQANTTGILNSFFGADAGGSNTTGSVNSFFGRSTGVSNTTGHSNSFLGGAAGASNTTGTENSYFGFGAGLANSSGSRNIIIGYLAGSALVSGSDNIYLAAEGAANESGTIRIGTQGTHTSSFIAGISGATSASGVNVLVNSSGQLGTLTSSRRYKQEIRDMGGASVRLMQLRPVSFLYKPEYVNGDRTLQYGLIAEEVAKVYPDLVTYAADGKPQTVRYHFLNTMLLNEMQRQQRHIQSQELRLASQSQKIAGQSQQISDLENRLRRLETVASRRSRVRQR